jgi:hypothetical protein
MDSTHIAILAALVCLVFITGIHIFADRPATTPMLSRYTEIYRAMVLRHDDISERIVCAIAHNMEDHVRIYQRELTRLEYAIGFVQETVKRTWDVDLPEVLSWRGNSDAPDAR